MKILDSFAGAGGWSVAIHSLGHTDDAIEIMPEALQTRVNAGYANVAEDVWAPGDRVLNDLNNGVYVGNAASPPCQSFSTAGSGAGRKSMQGILDLIPKVSSVSLKELKEEAIKSTGNDRSALVLTPLWYATHFPKLKWVAWEQVPTVQPIWDACVPELERAGYNVWTGKLRSEQYGVPQTRIRTILMAHREKQPNAPKPTHSKYWPQTPERLDPDVKKWLTMKDVFDNYSNIKNVDWEDRLRNVSGTAFDLDWFLNQPSGTIAGPARVGLRGSNSNRFNTATKFRSDGLRMTVEEKAILQTFPHDHPFAGSETKKHLQVGNAIPPLMAKAILRELI